MRPVTEPLRLLSNSPPVLVPGLDLGVGQTQLGRQLHTVLDTEVLLPLETLLQRLQLMVRERRPRLALLLAEPGVAGAARPVLDIVLVTCNRVE